MDREFYRAELLDKIKGMVGDTLIPTKQYKKVKQFITGYLEGRKNRVMKYTFSSALEAKHRFFANGYLIIKAKRGFSLQSVKRDYKSGRITLKDARHRIFTIMTIEKPKGNLRYLDMLTRMLLYNSWKMNKKLIQISTGNHSKRVG